MRVTFLNGTFENIAKEYFEKSKNVKINLNYYRKLKNKILLRNTNNFFKKIVIKRIQNYYSSYFAKNLDSDFKEFITAFSMEADVKNKDFLSLVLFPDVLSYIFSKFPEIKIPHDILGCSSVIKKHENGVEHGRNLDYFGGNIWSNSHEIIVVSPENGQKYITVCSEGFFSPGITAINESLISFSLHMLYTDDLNKKGTPILSILYSLLLKATSLNDITGILKNVRAISGWGIVASDHKTGEVSVFELTGNNLNEYKVTEKSFGYVNNFITNLKNREYLFSYAWIENNIKRLERIKELLNEDERIIDVLSDRTDNQISENCIGGYSVANNFTISSAVFNSKEDEILVADNNVPASIGVYKRYSLSELFKGSVVEKCSLKTKNASFSKENISILANSYDSYLIKGSKKKFIKAIEKIEEYPVNIFLAVMYAKIKKFKKALETIENLPEKKILKGHRLATIILLKGILKDILKQRDDAKAIYRELLKEYTFPDIHFWCLKFLNKPARKDILERMDINMFLSHFIIV